MNSSKDSEAGTSFKEEDKQASLSDTNANVNDVSKGAIPKKTKEASLKSVKTVKLNNNIENMPTLNSDETKVNGVHNGVPYYDVNIPSCSSLINGYFHKFDEQNDSSSDNDILSVSDDGCIYTYKGDHVADLPSSFYSLDIPPDLPDLVNRVQTSSPEMDYLEMDFDPGNNDDIEDSDLEQESGVECDRNIIDEESPDEIIDNRNDEALNDVIMENNQLDESNSIEIDESSSRVEGIVDNFSKVNVQLSEESDENMPWSCSLSERTKSINFRISKRCHCTKGELVSPNENVPPIRGAMVPTVQTPTEMQKIESVLFWSKEEAYLKQITQIGPSACGATAVLNVLNALRFPLPPIERIKECVTTRLRKSDFSLTEYLISRSSAGSTHLDLIEGLSKVSNGMIYARFFHMYPERVVNLYSWLTFWMKNGAVPIATLNLQRCIGTIPDAWHHQMIFGVDSSGIHLTNPLECVEAGMLWPQLCSESVLLVRRDDVLSRWNYCSDLPELMRIKDVRWKRINVVGQVANMIHESGRELRPGFTNTSHIRIPAAYKSGITLAITTNSSAYTLLQQTPELPHLDPHEKNAHSFSYY